MYITKIVLGVYFLAILMVGWWSSRRNSQLSDYVLAGRQLNPFVTAMGAAASDMSGWLLLALPGAFYLHGMLQLAMPIGLLLGAYANWLWLAPRLRVRTEALDDALTIPEYLSRRFTGHGSLIRAITAITILCFFTLYAGAGIVSAGLLFEQVFSISYHVAIAMFVCVIMLYTVLGGYLAVNLVDTFQGTLMFFVLMLVPLVTMYNLGGWHSTYTAWQLQPGFLHVWHGLHVLTLISLLAWGLGYFGQPHILVRFMSARREKDIALARRLCISWMFLALVGAALVGMVGRVYHPNLAHPETIFLELCKMQFNPFVAAILYSAVLSAVMSTVAAQLLAASSSLVEDIARQYWGQAWSPRMLLFCGRAAVVVLCFFAWLSAYSPHNTILQLVAYAWAGLGAAFGPVILCSLWWDEMSSSSAVAGIVVGGLVVVIWSLLKPLGGVFNMYSLLPGFMLSLLTIFLFGYLGSRQNKSI